MSSIQFEHEVIHSILHNTSHPLDDIIPNEVRQSVREMFSIPDEPFLSRSGRSKRGKNTKAAMGLFVKCSHNRMWVYVDSRMY